MNAILFDENTGFLRCGWRAAIFLFVFIFLVILLGVTSQTTLMAVGFDPVPGSGLAMATNALVSLFAALLVGWLCGRILEKLPFEALGTSITNGWLQNFALGVGVGAFTLLFAVLIAFTSNGLKFQLNDSAGFEILKSLTVSLAVFGVASAFEEVLFRGYLLQTFARSRLAWLAILLTSVFFGAVHYGNPNANLVSTANTVLAGVWFSVAYLKTRDLWFVWGIHLMWNWMQGSFFGIEVSGLTQISTNPFLKEIDNGPTWLTGETYGIEGGIACTIAIIVSIGAIVFLMPNTQVSNCENDARSQFRQSES